MAGSDKRMLSGWKTITFGAGVIGLFAAGFIFALGRTGQAADCLIGSLALILISAVFEWMGEVEHHLRQTASDTARCVDRLNSILSKLEAQEKDRHVEAVARAAQWNSGNPISDFVNGK